MSLSVPAQVEVNWDDIEKLWHHAFYNELRNAPEEHPVLASEAPFTPAANREKATQIMFETFSVPAYYTVLQQVLACYGAGKLTALVVDSGAGSTFAVPVYETYSLPYAIRTLDIGGNELTDHLCEHLNANNASLSFTTTAEKSWVRDMKEKLCYVSMDIDKDNNKFRWNGDSNKSYDLPDGQKVSVGAEMFRVPEAVFQPSLLGSSDPGLPTVVVKAIAACHPDLSSTLYGSIVLSGGNTMFDNFGDRLSAEVKKLADSSNSGRTRVSAPTERKHLTWIGGSILGSLSSFANMCISKQEYDEVGPAIVHRKCIQ